MRNYNEFIDMCISFARNRGRNSKENDEIPRSFR